MVTRNSQPTRLPDAYLRAATWVCAWISVSIPVFTMIVSVLSLRTTDPGWSMVTALLVVPVAILAAGTFGIATIVLALVLRFRRRDTSKRWLVSLVMGVFATVAVPLFVFVVISVPL